MEILSKIPSDKIEKRTLVCFNAVLFVFHIIQRKYQAIHEAVAKRENADMVLVVSLAWDIADWCERLRKILEGSSGIKKKEDWFRVIIQELRSVEDVRHFIQHYDRSISVMIESCEPSLGLVSAIFPKSDTEFDVSSFIPGTHRVGPGEEISFLKFKIPDKIIGPIDHITLHISNLKINISEIYRAVRLAELSMVEKIHMQYLS